MAVQFQDYYKTLGVARTASQEEIQKAYRHLARQYHPDINKAKGAEDHFKKVSEAYEVLKNPESRKKYDALGSNWKAGDRFTPPSGWGSGGAWQNVQFDFQNLGGGGFSSFFDTIFGSGAFGGGGSGSRSRRQPEPEPVVYKEPEIKLFLTPWEAALGATVQLQTLSGTVKLKIPPGSQSGTRMRLRGKGVMTRQGPGDLYVELLIKVPTRLTAKEKELFEALAKESRFHPRTSRI